MDVSQLCGKRGKTKKKKNKQKNQTQTKQYRIKATDFVLPQLGYLVGSTLHVPSSRKQRKDGEIPPNSLQI